MCPKTYKNTNTYYRHVRRDHSDKYAADSSVANKYLLSANTQMPNSMDKDSNESPDSATVPVTTSDQSDDNTIGMEHNITSDVTKVASGHLIQLKCKAGVTQSILPSIVEMNEAVVDSVLDNISCKVSERLQANGVGPVEPLATDIKEIIESSQSSSFTSHYLLPKFNDAGSLSNGCKYTHNNNNYFCNSNRPSELRIHVVCNNTTLL